MEPIVSLKAKMWDIKCPAGGPKYPTSGFRHAGRRRVAKSGGWHAGRRSAENAWLGLEAVAHAWFGQEVAGAGRLLLQLAAQLGDVDAQVVGLGAVSGAPHVLE